MKNSDSRNRFVKNEIDREQINNTKYYSWLKELTSRINIDFIDLLPAFKQTAISETNIPLFYPNDGHFTSFGHQVTASVLEEKLLEIISKLSKE